MIKKERHQEGESFETRMDRLNSETGSDSYYLRRRWPAHILAKKYKEDLVGATIETEAGDLYVIRDVVDYKIPVERGRGKVIPLPAFEATRLDHHNADRPHVVTIHPSATVQVADFRRFFIQFGTRYRQILEEINSEGKHNIEIPPKKDSLG